MGFWQGINAGLAAVQEEKSRKRERQQEIDIRRQEIEEERANQRDLWNKKVLHEQTMAAIPLLVESRKADIALAKQREQYGNFFNTRLSDVPEETRVAFSNLALQDPTYSEALIEAVQKTEAPNQLGRRLTGQEILKLANIFEQTKPDEGTSIEDWIKQAASMTLTTGSAIDYDATLERLLSGDLSLQDVQKTQMDLMLSGPSVTTLPTDFDYSAVMGGDPSTTIQLRNLASSVAKDQFQKDLAVIEAEAATFKDSAEEPSKDWKTRYGELSRISAISNAEERDSAIFNYYAPIVLPKLAEQEPRYKRLFPEFFQPVSPAEQYLTEDDLKYLGMN